MRRRILPSSQQTLPPESSRTLDYIDAQIDDVMTRNDAEPFALFGFPVALTREAIIDFCLDWETRHAARRLTAHVARPQLDSQMFYELN